MVCRLNCRRFVPTSAPAAQNVEQRIVGSGLDFGNIVMWVSAACSCCARRTHRAPSAKIWHDIFSTKNVCAFVFVCRIKLTLCYCGKWVGLPERCLYDIMICILRKTSIIQINILPSFIPIYIKSAWNVQCIIKQIHICSDMVFRKQTLSS